MTLKTHCSLVIVYGSPLADPLLAQISDIYTSLLVLSLQFLTYISTWIFVSQAFWTSKSSLVGVLSPIIDVFSTDSFFCSSLPTRTIDCDFFWLSWLLLRLCYSSQHCLSLPGTDNTLDFCALTNETNWYIILHLAVLTGRCPRWNSKHKTEVLYLSQFFQLRVHTRLPEDLPPRGLAPGCHVPSVAAATGKNILIVSGPKSKDNAVTLGWGKKWKQTGKCINTLALYTKHTAVL